MASQAKQAVKDFIHKAGNHDTTVTEKVAPAVTNETVQRTQHENTTTAVDKETHQDHYHTSVQPVNDQQVLKEQHHHNVIPVEHRSFEHGNSNDVERKLAQEASQFKDTKTHVKGEHTHSAAPVVGGEHVHHHVHETIQPVVNKQTIEPHVVHTTVPIHEVHHNTAQHHATSALPAVDMADFKKQGGVLGGREARHDGFEGEPRNVGTALGSHSGSHPHTGHSTTGSGLGSSTGSTGLTGSSTTGSGLGSTTSTHNQSTRGTGLGSNTGSGLGSTTGTHGTTSQSTTGSGLGSTTGTYDDRSTLGKIKDSITGNSHSSTDNTNHRNNAI